MADPERSTFEAEVEELRARWAEMQSQILQICEALSELLRPLFQQFAELIQSDVCEYILLYSRLANHKTLMWMAARLPICAVRRIISGGQSQRRTGDDLARHTA